MGRYESSIRIEAPASRVWQVLCDVERWPSWTATMRSVRWLTGGPLAVGQRAAIRQPRMPPLTWTVTDLRDGSSFTWVTGGAGVRTSAEHDVAGDDSGCVFSQRLVHAGPLAGLVDLVYGGLTRRYLQVEARGLQQACEATVFAEPDTPGQREGQGGNRGA